MPVANPLLKKDCARKRPDGLLTRLLCGGSTDGDNDFPGGGTVSGISIPGSRLCACPQHIRKEVVAFVVGENDGGEVDHFDLADGFRAEFFHVDDLDGLDVFFGDQGRGAADGAEVEAVVFGAVISGFLKGGVA
nr:hypothetical protein [Pontiella desulfatans]